LPLTRRRAQTFLLLILLVGAFFRFIDLRWDEGFHLHPDERFISMVEEKLSVPASISQYFDSSSSPLNPYNRGNSSFVYGTVPVFLAKAVGSLIRMKGYDGAYLVGRALSGFFDLITVWIVYLLTRRVAPRLGRGAALAAAGLLAFCPLAIQLSHFWTSDTFLTTFSILALLGAVRHARGESGIPGDAATGIAVGLAVACKVTGLALLLPAGIAVLIRAFGLASPGAPAAFATRIARAFGRFFVIAAAAAITIRIALPYAFLGPSPFSFRPDPRWLDDLKRLVALSGSVAGFPPALQWAGRTVLFPLYNFIFWAGGPFFGIAALAGLVWACIAIVRKREWILAPLLAHAAFLIAYHAAGLAKTLRYFYPAYPILAVLAAVALAALGRSAPATGPRRLLRLATVVAVLGTLLWGGAFAAIYGRPHSRVEASRWIHAHVPHPTTIANEAWDDGLPFSFPGYDSSVFSGVQMDVWGPDTPDKVRYIVSTLEKTDWIAITSNRVYANITRLPMVYPMTTAYYRALFEGRLGFERAAEFTSYPSLGPLRIPDDRSEEQFTVYDHPRVLLFRKTKDFSSDRASKILQAAMPATPPTIWEWEKLPRSRRAVGSSLLPPRRADLEKAATSGLPSGDVGSIAAAVLWYVVLLLLAVLALPAVHLCFPRLQDRGAGFARIAGLVLATYFLNLLVRLRVVENGRGAAALAVLLVAAASAAVFWKRKDHVLVFLRERRRLLVAGEIAFAAGFLLFLGIRALNPEIYWGEKPMDFSILNILVRTRTLPASDPWFAGAPLSYYAFGHEMVAFLTLLTGLSTRYTFNLAFGLLGGVTMQAAFSLARSWANSLRAGIAGAVLTAVLGNFSGLREWLVNKRHLDWDYFWATSRVIPNTINEYPIWSLTFADLHAHVLAMPLLLLFFACALQFVRTHGETRARRGERTLHAALLGFSAAVVALTNAWDIPLLAGLLLLATLVAVWSGGRISFVSERRAAYGLVVAVATALLAAAPFWVRTGVMPGIGRNQDVGRGIDILLVFGFFFFLAFAGGLDCVNERLAKRGLGKLPRLAFLAGSAVALLLLGVLRIDILLGLGVLFFLFAALRLAETAERRLIFGFLAASFFLVLFAQHFYIYDRMNTFFKLYFEAWLLLSISTAVLVFGRPERPGAFRRWSLPVRALVIVLALPALFTSTTGVWGALGRHFAAYSGPSLDGLRYLEQGRPGEYHAVVWMRRSIRGTPVVLEAQGPSYQDFGRISMLTGLPTVLGWDYHVKQRGNPDIEIEARKKVVEQIYAGSGIGTIEGLLRRYHVRYVYVGWLEKKTYPPAALKKFDGASAKGILELAYENPEAKIYRVVGGENEDVILVTREALPATARTEPQGEEPEEPPSISDSAEPDRPPYSGMREPRDAAVDSRKRLWVADFGNNRLRVFDQNGGYLGGWGGRGNGTFGLREPCAVAIAGDDLYIADTWNGRVQHFTLAGEWKGTATSLYGPRGVAVAPDGKVWVTDTGNNRVVVYDAALSQIQTVGKRGSGPGDLTGPVGIAAGPRGSIAVADTGNLRISFFNANGSFLTSVPFPGWAGGSVEAHVEVDEDESLYVTDPNAAVVLQLEPSGKVRARWTEDGKGQKFAKPTGIALDSKARILYVVNSGSNTVLSIPLPKAR
jgi:YYY domain-containing protein